MEAAETQPIDTVAHAALMTCDEPIEDIVARLSSRGRTTAHSALYGRIHVSRPKGVVSVKFDTSDGVTWAHGRIVVRGRPRPDGMDRHAPHEDVNGYVGHGFLVDGTRINSMIDAHGGSVVWISVRSPVRSV